MRGELNIARHVEGQINDFRVRKRIRSSHEGWGLDGVEIEGVCVEFAVEETGATGGERVGVVVEADSDVVG